MALPFPAPSYKSREHPLPRWNVSGCFSPLQDHQAWVLTVSHTNVQAKLSSAPFAPSSLVTCLGQIEWPLGVNTGAGGKEKNWLASLLAWLLSSFCPSYSLPPSLPPGSRGLNPWMSVAVPVQSVSGVSGIRGTSPYLSNWVSAPLQSPSSGCSSPVYMERKTYWFWHLESSVIGSMMWLVLYWVPA